MNFEYLNLKDYRTKELKNIIQEVLEGDYTAICLPENTTYITKKIVSDNLKIGVISGFPTEKEFSVIQKNPKLGAYAGKYTHNQIQHIRDLRQADELTLMFPYYWYHKKYLIRIKSFFLGVKDLFQKPIRVNIELGTLVKNRLNLWTINNLLEEGKVDIIQTNSNLFTQDFDFLIDKIKLLQTITKLPIHVRRDSIDEEQIKKLEDLNIQRVITTTRG